ncbi:MAG: hypothetical protein IKQ59_06660 [Prevotella sp.]|nr:hypothetical protein [Prevotella sp.]
MNDFKYNEVTGEFENNSSDCWIKKIISKRFLFWGISLILLLIFSISFFSKYTGSSGIYIGSVGKYGIVLNIQTNERGAISGWCYYTRIGSVFKIPIEGNCSGNHYYFSEFEDGKSISKFDLHYNNKSLTGYHHKYDTGRKLKVNIRKEQNPLSLFKLLVLSP